MDLGKESKFEIVCGDLHLVGIGRVATAKSIPQGVDVNGWLWSAAKSIVVEIEEAKRIFDIDRPDSDTETFAYEPVDAGIYGIDATGKMTKVGDVGEFD